MNVQEYPQSLLRFRYIGSKLVLSDSHCKILLMRKLFVLLFISASIGLSAQNIADCSMMCVLNITIDTTNSTMDVTLFNGDTNGINYPTIRVVDQNGDTVGNPNGTFVLFMQGQGTMTHTIPTTMTTALPQPFYCTVVVTDQVWDTSCVFSYPMSCPMNVNTVEQHDKFAVYPNPATDLLSISLPSGISGKVDLSVTNVLGEVFHGPVLAINGKINLNVADYAAGVYFVSVTVNDQKYMQRFVRE